jgi:hypothetical protein
VKLNINKIYYLPNTTRASEYRSIFFHYNPECHLKDSKFENKWVYRAEDEGYSKDNPLGSDYIGKGNNYKGARPQELVEIDMKVEDFSEKLRLVNKLCK